MSAKQDIVQRDLEKREEDIEAANEQERQNWWRQQNEDDEYIEEQERGYDEIRSQ